MMPLQKKTSSKKDKGGGLLIFLKTTTYFRDPDANSKSLSAWLLYNRDIVRWLYFQEFGFDIGLMDDSVREELKIHYRTEMWGGGNEALHKAMSLLTLEEVDKAKKDLTKILVWAKPFLDYVRQNRQY